MDLPASLGLNDVGGDGHYSSPIESDGRRFFTMIGTLIRGRISVAGTAGSATKRALAIAVGYANTRRQFERPGGQGEVVLLDYRAHQRKLLPALATSYALSFAQHELVGTLGELSGAGPRDERRQRELESRAAGIKAVASWHATATIQACREACGGAGYLAENLLTTLKADTDVFTTFEGDNTVLLQLVAKGLLTNYQSQVGDLGTLATARFGDRGESDAFAIFNDAQDHLLRTARAHIDRVVLEAFVAAVERCPNPGARALLSRVCDLYVLATIEADLAWFLAHGRLTAARAKAVTGAVNALCELLRPHAQALADAFAVPRPALAAAILDQEPA